MIDLDTKIRELVVTLVEAAPPPPVPAGPQRTTDRPTDLETPGTPNSVVSPIPAAVGRPRRRWAVAAVAMAASLVLFGGTAILVRWALGGEEAGAPSPIPPHVLIPIEDASARSAGVDEAAAGFRSAYESGDSAAVLRLLDSTVLRQDAVFPSVLRSRDLVRRTLFPEATFEPDCTYASHLVGAGEGLYLAECAERFDYDFPPEAPLNEISHWEVSPSGQIRTWTLHYGLDALDRLAAMARDDSGFPADVSDGVDAARALLADYEAIWSSRDLSGVADLYTAEARREDTLLEQTLFGRDAIREHAMQFLAWYPSASWSLADGFTNLDGATGGVFTITTPGPDGAPCEVRIAVRLIAPGGRIEQESVYYDVDSLAACGWAA